MQISTCVSCEPRHAAHVTGVQPYASSIHTSITSKHQVVTRKILRERCLRVQSSRNVVPVTARQSQGGNQATRRRTSGPPSLPPVRDNGWGGGGGGGGDDGWNLRRVAMNIIPNAAFMGLYFAVTSWGGDGFGAFLGGGDGGGGSGGSGGGGGGGDGSSSRPSSSDRSGNPGQDGEDDEDKEARMTSRTYRGNTGYYSGRSTYR